MSIWMFGTLRRLDEEDEGELQQREDGDVVKMSQITTGRRSPLAVIVQVVVVVAGKTDLIGVDSFTDRSRSRSEDFTQMTRSIPFLFYQSPFKVHRLQQHVTMLTIVLILIFFIFTTTSATEQHEKGKKEKKKAAESLYSFLSDTTLGMTQANGDRDAVSGFFLLLF